MIIGCVGITCFHPESRVVHRERLTPISLRPVSVRGFPGCLHQRVRDSTLGKSDRFHQLRGQVVVRFFSTQALIRIGRNDLRQDFNF